MLSCVIVVAASIEEKSRLRGVEKRTEAEGRKKAMQSRTRRRKKKRSGCDKKSSDELRLLMWSWLFLRPPLVHPGSLQHTAAKLLTYA